MPQLELTVTEQIDAQHAQRLATALRRHLEVGDPQTRYRRAADPSEIQQYIQILGDAALWLPLLYAATVFLKSYVGTFGQRAGNATWDGLAALFKKDEVKPLAEVATALAEAREASSGRIVIVVGLDIPNRHFGTALPTTANSAEEIAHSLAVFVTHANELSAMMKAEVAAGRAPLGPAVITLDNEGGLTVRWRSKDFTEHKKRIP